MPKERDPRRDEARKLWELSGGEIDLVEISAKLNVSPGTVRGWKSKDQWERNERSAPKYTERSGTPVIKDVRTKEPAIANDELTDKQRIFVLEYMRDFNITRSAMAAGYSKKAAHVVGWETLRNPKVQAEIKRLKDILSDELGLDVRRIIAEYMKIAFADVTDLMEFGQREVPVMSMFGPLKGDDGEPLMKTVNYVDFKSSNEIDGTVISEVKQGKDGVSIKLHDKMRALEKLEKYVGFMSEEEKLKLTKLQAEIKALEGPGDSKEDDGFIDALKGKASEIWADDHAEPSKTDDGE